MEWLHSLIYHFRHFNIFLKDMAEHHPTGVYGLIVAIVFCETGLVVTPFLPGDSLLFLVGALAASHVINLPVAIVLLCVAANCGDLLNYTIGRKLGPAVFRRESSFLLNKKHLLEAQAFYDKHGRKTIILARFIPIVRTFAPFVAGIGRMEFTRFVGFSIFGGVLWVTLLSLAGYFFGQYEFVQAHFEMVVIAIVVISVLPVVFHALTKKKNSQGSDAVVQDQQVR